jgi:3-hydroxymyristoyl/3-hydroxydecanoyl-(acyl carrier protein) dehydratase
MEFGYNVNDDMFQILSDKICLEAVSESAVMAAFTPPADLAPFNGHFPGNPILPGVGQISLITEILKKAYRRNFTLVTVKRIKFMAPILPEMPLSVSVKNDNGSVNADIVSGENKISNLKLIYECGEAL